MDYLSVLKPTFREKEEKKDESSRGSLIGSKLFQEMQPLVQRLNESEERTCRELLAEEGITVTDEEVKLFFSNPFLDDSILLFKGVFAFAFGIFD